MEFTEMNLMNGCYFVGSTNNVFVCFLGGEGGGVFFFFMKAEFNMSDLVSEYQQYQDAIKRKRQKANINSLSSVNTPNISMFCILVYYLQS